MNTFLYSNPAAPAVVGFFVFVMLAWYAITRREVRLGERPEGPPAAHPFALLVQSLLVLLREKRLLGLLLGLHVAATVAEWPYQLRWAEQIGSRAGLTGPLNADALHRELSEGRAALAALREGLPGSYRILPLGLFSGAVLGVALAALLLRYCSGRPAWLTEARLAPTAAISFLCLASAVGVAAYWARMAHELRSPGPVWLDALSLLAGLPVAVLPHVFALAAVFEVVATWQWSLQAAARRAAYAFWPYLIWAVATQIVFQLAMLKSLWTEAWRPAWLDIAGLTINDWLPIIFFPLPWVFLERETGFLAGLRKSLLLIRDNAALVLTFALRLACLFAPVLFVLRAVERASSHALALHLVATLLLQLFTLLAAMAVCRAYVSIIGRENLAVSAAPSLAGDVPPVAE